MVPGDAAPTGSAATATRSAAASQPSSAGLPTSPSPPPLPEATTPSARRRTAPSTPSAPALAAASAMETRRTGTCRSSSRRCASAAWWRCRRGTSTRWRSPTAAPPRGASAEHSLLCLVLLRTLLVLRRRLLLGEGQARPAWAGRHGQPALSHAGRGAARRGRGLHRRGRAPLVRRSAQRPSLLVGTRRQRPAGRGGRGRRAVPRGRRLVPARGQRPAQRPAAGAGRARAAPLPTQRRGTSADAVRALSGQGPRGGPRARAFGRFCAYPRHLGAGPAVRVGALLRRPARYRDGAVVRRGLDGRASRGDRGRRRPAPRPARARQRRRVAAGGGAGGGGVGGHRRALRRGDGGRACVGVGSLRSGRRRRAPRACAP
mmetsp:Transcript_3080/g.10163  ORF Transcript_3080/g.10163 Transcript_3080/m.10163 type:complete len:374 (+) Transcript_3080:608-1729(+)